MQPNTILSAQLIDIVFDGRNKNYGAYYLRKTYSKRLLIALFLMTCFVGLVFGAAKFAVNRVIKKPRITDRGGYVIKKVVEATPPKSDKPKPKESVPVKTKPHTEPLVIKDDDVQKPPVSNDDLTDAQVGTQDIDGKPFDGTATDPAPPGDNTGIVEPKAEPVNDTPFTAVEIAAKYTGNWVNFLLINLDGDVPVNNNAPTGTYSVVIQFVVDREGHIGEINALTSHGYGMEEEAIRVIKKSNRWEPAIQNGIKVKAYHKQVITFQVVE